MGFLDGAYGRVVGTSGKWDCSMEHMGMWCEESRGGGEKWRKRRRRGRKYLVEIVFKLESRSLSTRILAILMFRALSILGRSKILMKKPENGHDIDHPALCQLAFWKFSCPGPCPYWADLKSS